MAVLKVGFAVHEGVQALDVAGPIDVFAEANTYVSPENRFETVVIGPHRRPLRASNNMLIMADLAFPEADGGFDILLVAGSPALPSAEPDMQLIEWLSLAPTRASTYGSICTGAFALGHAGLLDGRRVTTHWQNADLLAAKFPAAQVERDAIYVRDRRLVTSAGVTAGIDLALALVGERHGRGIALMVAKRLVVVAQRQGGQSQFSPYLTAPSDPESPVATIQQHVMENIRDRHTLQSLANLVGMSARNFARHFVQETGITPHEFIERARVDAARNLLEGSDRQLKVIAYDCGFGTADRMRIIFTDRLGVTPAQYRLNFRRLEGSWTT
ncbi:GlxA family transcriptional regulator [Rhizobium leguminosarum]|uniref:GlxA family transcriptional regulator n=1 Tax=Rhizobium leguminosarum TaxID=384 RepID=UPI0024A7AF13|nr:GlxA family transcriptional regulator [Rhizobium leguminosarum]MDI5928455.1 GlxA family transcriptional regulator [Rhizobium leguminosarum]